MPIFVNSFEITDDEVHQEMQYHPAPSLEAARHQASQALVVRALLVEAARAQDRLGPNDTNPENIENAVDQLICETILIPKTDEEASLRYYEQNAARFVDKKTQQTLPFESVQHLIEDYLKDRSFRTGVQNYIESLAFQSKIVGFEF